MSAHHPLTRAVETRSGMVHHAFLACPAKINSLTGGRRDLIRAPTSTVITCLWCMATWARSVLW